MRDEITQLIERFEARLDAANKERKLEELPRLKQVKLKLLGQMALLADESSSTKLRLARTADCDALVDGDWSVRLLFKEALSEMGLVYDDLSSEAWIPPGSKYHVLHESELLKVFVLDYMNVLVSKAIKAPEKNRIVIGQALAVFGEPLAEAIEKFGGDLDFFLKGAGR